MLRNLPIKVNFKYPQLEETTLPTKVSAATPATMPVQAGQVMNFLEDPTQGMSCSDVCLE